MHVAQCPTTEARRGLARDVATRGLRHEPTATVTQRRAEDRETVSATRVARPKRDSKCPRLGVDAAHTRNTPGAARPWRDSNHAQDGLEFNPPVFLDVRKACAGKKVLIMGLPGAFTPC